MKLQSKKKNRIKSFIYIGVFIASICVLVVVSVYLGKSISKNHELIQIRDQLLQEKDYQERDPQIYEEDCYTVYVRDDYSLIDDSDNIFIFKGK